MGDLVGETFTATLEDLVGLLDNPNPPGLHLATVIALINAETQHRHPQRAGPDGRRMLHVTAAEYSDIKRSVIQSLQSWMKSRNSSGGSRVA